MRVKPLTVLFEPKYVVVKATIAGFYKSLGKKFDLCRHVVCGYSKPPRTQCNARPDDAVPKPDNWNSWWVQRQVEHKNKGCTNKWCVVEHGPFKEIEDNKVKCARSYYHLYDEQELANPETKVEYIALEMTVASRWAHYVVVGVYDLHNDKWANDDWWSTTPKGDLMPCNQTPPDVTPREVHGIEGIIAKAKVGL